MTEDDADHANGTVSESGHAKGAVGAATAPPPVDGSEDRPTGRTLPYWVNPATVKGTVALLVGFNLLYSPKIS